MSAEDVNILSSDNQGNVKYGPVKEVIGVVLAAGANVLVAAVESQQIQIMSILFSVGRGVTLTLRTGSDDIMPINAGGKGGMSLLQGPEPIIVGKIGQDINLHLSGSPGDTAGAVLTYRMAETY